MVDHRLATESRRRRDMTGVWVHWTGRWRVKRTTHQNIEGLHDLIFNLFRMSNVQWTVDKRLNIKIKTHPHNRWSKKRTRWSEANNSTLAVPFSNPARTQSVTSLCDKRRRCISLSVSVLFYYLVKRFWSAANGMRWKSVWSKTNHALSCTYFEKGTGRQSDIFFLPFFFIRSRCSLLPWLMAVRWRNGSTMLLCWMNVDERSEWLMLIWKRHVGSGARLFFCCFGST